MVALRKYGWRKKNLEFRKYLFLIFKTPIISWIITQNEIQRIEMLTVCQYFQCDLMIGFVSLGEHLIYSVKRNQGLYFSTCYDSSIFIKLGSNILVLQSAPIRCLTKFQSWHTWSTLRDVIIENFTLQLSIIHTWRIWYVHVANWRPLILCHGGKSHYDMRCVFCNKPFRHRLFEKLFPFFPL